MSVFEIITEEEFSGGTSSGAPSSEAAGVGIIDSLPVDTYPCNYCGHCETPNDCAWSHTCPTCGAPAGVISTATYCKHPQGGIVGLHAERWL